MDDFRRMMEMHGVLPLGQRRHGGTPSRKPTAPVTPSRARSTPAPVEVSQEVPVPVVARQAWASGPTARSALEVALQRVKDGDGTGWAIAVLGDGATRSLPTLQGASRLLSEADRLNARLVLIGSGANDRSSKPFTFVMHPMQGIATLDNDPEEEA